MNEFKPVLSELLELVKSTKDFTLEQAPLYFQELVAYEISSSCVAIMACTIFLILSLSFLINDKKSMSTDSKLIINTICSIIAFTSIICLFENVDSVIKAKIAPRVMIIDKLKQAVK